MIKKINWKNIEVIVDLTHYIWDSTFDYIAKWLEKWFNYWILRSKTKNNKIWEWRVQDYNSYIEKLYYENT